jgi:hypothetical protein
MAAYGGSEHSKVRDPQSAKMDDGLVRTIRRSHRCGFPSRAGRPFARQHRNAPQAPSEQQRKGIEAMSHGWHVRPRSFHSRGSPLIVNLSIIASNKCTALMNVRAMVRPVPL